MALLLYVTKSLCICVLLTVVLTSVFLSTLFVQIDQRLSYGFQFYTKYLAVFCQPFSTMSCIVLLVTDPVSLHALTLKLSLWSVNVDCYIWPCMESSTKPDPWNPHGLYLHSTKPRHERRPLFTAVLNVNVTDMGIEPKVSTQLKTVLARWAKA